MQHLNWLDYTIIIVIALSALISLTRGFIREALSLASWIIAFWASLTFSNLVSKWFAPYIHSNSIRYAVAFIAIFLTVLILGAFVNFIITRLAEKTGLSGTDRLVGVVFGFARGVLLVAIVLLAAQMTAFPHEPAWTQSRLIPQFVPIETWLAKYIPKDIQKSFKNSHRDLNITNGTNKNDPKSSIVVIRKATNDTKMLDQQRNQ